MSSRRAAGASANQHPHPHPQAGSATTMLDNSVFSLLSVLKLSFFSHLDDDLVDRFNYYYTPLLLIIFAIVSGSKQFFGHPIECLLPQVFAHSGMESYAEQYCWVSNTYYVPVGETVPTENERRELQLHYYQWVPFVLTIQAITCYIPCIIWRFMSWKTGVDLRLIVQLALSLENVNVETRQRNCNAIARYLHHTFETHYCKRQQSLQGSGCSRLLRQLRLDFAFAKHGYGMHLTCSYLFAKFLYCVNIPLQLFIVCRFIGSSTMTYGLDYLHDMIWNNTDASRSTHFPLITLCDIVTRSFANNQRFTLECVLPINLVNDKLFLFIWWWLLFLGVITMFNMLSWLYNVSSPRSRSQFIRKFLKLTSAEGVSDKKLCLKFTFNYLQNDGIVIMRLFSQNCGPVITCDVLRLVWSSYLRRFEPRKTEIVALNEPPSNNSCSTPQQIRHNNNNNNNINNNNNNRSVGSSSERHKDASSFRKVHAHRVIDSASNGVSMSMSHSVPRDPTTVVFLPTRHNNSDFDMDSPSDKHGLNL